MHPSTELEIPEQERTQAPPQGPSQALQSPIKDSSEIHEEGPDSEMVKAMAKLEQATLDNTLLLRKLEQAILNNTSISRKTVCIYRVSHCLSESAKKAYVPQQVSVGPYHHADEHLRHMDDRKWRALRHWLQRTKQKLNLNQLLVAARELEERARACYEEPISLGSNEFNLMMLLDGCFVLELLQGVTENNGFKNLGYSVNDPFFTNNYFVHHRPDMLIQLRQDMLMLENQLPLFVLERLLELQLGIAYKKGDAALLIAKFFRHSGLTTLTEEPWPTEVLLSIKGSLHCLDVFRECILKKCWIEKDVDERRSLSKCPSQKQHYIHSLKTLRKVGIKFKKRENCRFWDIKFNGGVLEIPQLYIYHDTKSLLLNLIAFEKCHPECIKNVTCYVLFMDNLIKSAKDVAYLRSRGIITGLESNDEVADLFNGLCKEIVFSGGCSYLCELSRHVNWYFNLKYKFASLKHKFVNDPRAIFVTAIFFTAAAVSFLLLTFLALKLYVLLYG